MFPEALPDPAFVEVPNSGEPGWDSDSTSGNKFLHFEINEISHRATHLSPGHHSYYAQIADLQGMEYDLLIESHCIARTPAEQYAVCRHMGAFITWIWLGGIALQAALAAVIVSRKVWARFPFFAAYVLTNLGANGLLYLLNALHASMLVYFNCYWITQAITLLLGLATVFEIFVSLLVSHPRLRKPALRVCRYTLLALGLFGALVIVLHPQGETTPNAPMFALEEAVRIVEVGLVVLLFVLAGIFGLPWRQSAFGIAFGIGLYASVQLIAVAWQSYAGLRASYITAIVSMLAFDLSLLIWMGSLLSRQYAARNVELLERVHPED